MENVKHNVEEADLKGFEKKFCDGVKRLLMVVCDATQAEVDNITCGYIDDEMKILHVNATLNVEPADETPDIITKYTSTLCEHFQAFFTPAHYRPYVTVLAKEVYGEEKISVCGTYQEGV